MSTGYTSYETKKDARSLGGEDLATSHGSSNVKDKENCELVWDNSLPKSWKVPDNLTRQYKDNGHSLLEIVCMCRGETFLLLVYLRPQKSELDNIRY